MGRKDKTSTSSLMIGKFRHMKIKHNTFIQKTTTVKSVIRPKTTHTKTKSYGYEENKGRTGKKNMNTQSTS